MPSVLPSARDTRHQPISSVPAKFNRMLRNNHHVPTHQVSGDVRLGALRNGKAFQNVQGFRGPIQHDRRNLCLLRGGEHIVGTTRHRWVCTNVRFSCWVDLNEQPLKGRFNNALIKMEASGTRPRLRCDDAARIADDVDTLERSQTCRCIADVSALIGDEARAIEVGTNPPRTAPPLDRK